ncbi:histidinol dehydrogenase [Thermotoga sp. Ku-13t]|uniref:histidinol dehydrogenase n=1 Tax=Thermotoga sp. Ku-13t TaxID=1755813 RepID=UPI0013EC8635|nr:histidinol dehydrogenase [Thermotoga sp. Ku-13t]KAF2958616.1 histidinol dehydrogenase [Thermotoga sp. Ku-13t]
MKILIEPAEQQLLEILEERRLDFANIEKTVREIVEDVKHNGQAALEKYIALYEKCALKGERILISEEELDAVKVEEEFKDLCEKFIEKLERFHSMQLQASMWNLTPHGSFVGCLVRPIESVAIYVPAGRRVYFTTLLMCAVPAKIAGVERIVVVCPPNEDGKVPDRILYLCRRLNIREIYKIGGAHAIAALAYGTSIVKKVDKIVGPGNAYVSCAKKLVFGDCGIDSVAGPTELLIVADSTAKPAFVAADMLAQAEHDEMAMSALVTDDENLLDGVLEELARQLNSLGEPNRSVAKVSLEKNGLAVLVRDLKDAIEVVNLLAPEHLELFVEDPFSWLGRVKNAGSTFVGNSSAEAFGDYGVGPNHVLPTLQNARFTSGLSVQDFLKKIFVTLVSEEEVKKQGEFYVKLARLEGFEAHARSIEVRMEGAR